MPGPTFTTVPLSGTVSAPVAIKAGEAVALYLPRSLSNIVTVEAAPVTNPVSADAWGALQLEDGSANFSVASRAAGSPMGVALPRAAGFSALRVSLGVAVTEVQTFAIMTKP